MEEKLSKFIFISRFNNETIILCATDIDTAWYELTNTYNNIISSQFGIHNNETVDDIKNRFKNINNEDK